MRTSEGRDSFIAQWVHDINSVLTDGVDSVVSWKNIPPSILDSNGKKLNRMIKSQKQSVSHNRFFNTQQAIEMKSKIDEESRNDEEKLEVEAGPDSAAKDLILNLFIRLLSTWQTERSFEAILEDTNWNLFPNLLNVIKNPDNYMTRSSSDTSGNEIKLLKLREGAADRITSFALTMTSNNQQSQPSIVGTNEILSPASLQNRLQTPEEMNAFSPQPEYTQYEKEYWINLAANDGMMDYDEPIPEDQEPIVPTPEELAAELFEPDYDTMLKNRKEHEGY